MTTNLDVFFFGPQSGRKNSSFYKVSSFLKLDEQNEIVSSMPKRTLPKSGSVKAKMQSLNDKAFDLQRFLSKPKNLSRLLRLLCGHVARAVIRGYVVYLLWNGRKFYQLKLKELFLSREGMNMGVSFGILVFTFKVVQQLLRAGWGGEKFRAHAIAGGCAGLSLYFSPISNGILRTFGLASLVRGLHELAEIRFWTQDLNWGNIDAWLYTVSVGVLVYNWVHRPKSLPAAYSKSLEVLSSVKQKTIHLAFKNKDISILPMPLETFLMSLRATIPIYSFVHIAPSLLFRSHRLLKDPTTFLIRRAVGIARSSLMFSGMSLVLITGVRTSHYFNWSEKYTPIFGMAGGLAIFIEQSSRWKSFVLYIAPQIVRSLLSPYVNLQSREISTIFFAGGLAGLCFCDSTDKIGGTSQFLVRLFVGTNRMAPIAEFWNTTSESRKFSEI